MEHYIQLIFILALAKYCLKAAMTGRLRTMVLYALAAATLALLLYPVVITQPVTLAAGLLADRRVVTDAAVLTTLEATLGIFVSIYLLDNYFKPRAQRRRRVFVLKVVPGLLWMFGVAYFELLFFRERVGADFRATAALYAGILFAAVLLTAWILHTLVRRESMRLELKILLNMAILLIGLLVHATIADYNLSNARSTVAWDALGALLGTAALLFAFGLWLSRTDKLTPIITFIKRTRNGSDH